MTDTSAVTAAIAQVRQGKDANYVEVRLAAEAKARELLDTKAGSFDVADLSTLFEYFRSDGTGGKERQGRFKGSFTGFHAAALADNLGEVNDRLARLWSDDGEASRTADSMLRDTGRLALPMGGQSFPTMVLYVKDPARFAVAQSVLTRGCRALGVNTTYNRTKGWASYLGWCQSAQAFAAEHGLAIQEVDAVYARADPGPPADLGSDRARNTARAEVAERRCSGCYQIRRVTQFAGDSDMCSDCI